MHEPSQFSACFPMTGRQTDRQTGWFLFFFQKIIWVWGGLSKQANVACLRHYVRAFCVCQPLCVCWRVHGPSCVWKDGRLQGREDVLAKLCLIPLCPLSSCHIPSSFTVVVRAGGAALAALRFQPCRDSCPGFFGAPSVVGGWRQQGAGPGRQSHDPKGLLELLVWVVIIVICLSDCWCPTDIDSFDLKMASQ